MIDSLLIAVAIGWIMTVCLHEYAHALAAYLAGDRSVAQRGYLSMNPLSYLDPVMSILVPTLALLFGAVPLPGGAVHIERSALRKPWYGSFVAAAGPATNLVLGLLFTIPIHPRLGLVNPWEVDAWPAWAIFAGTMALLQIFAFLLNLLPVPPLDGIKIIEPFLPLSTRLRLEDPQVNMIGMFVLLFVLLTVRVVWEILFRVAASLISTIGIPEHVLAGCFRQVF